jgi:hypothetical protein
LAWFADAARCRDMLGCRKFCPLASDLVIVIVIALFILFGAILLGVIEPAL